MLSDHGKNYQYPHSVTLRIIKNRNKETDSNHKVNKMSIKDVHFPPFTNQSHPAQEDIQRIFNEKYKRNGELGISYRDEFKVQVSSIVPKINQIDIAIINSDIQQLIIYCESRHPHTDNLPNIFAAQTKFVQTYLKWRQIDFEIKQNQPDKYVGVWLDKAHEILINIARKLDLE